MNTPLGGTLINRECPAGDLADRLRYAATLKKIPADRNLILDLEKIANGTFSPLTGFMGRADCQSVLNTMHMANGTPWTIPIVFHARASQLEGVRSGTDVAIVNTEESNISAILSVSEIYEYNKDEFCTKVFQVNDPKHPGVGQVMGWGDRLVAGTILLLQHSKSLIPGKYDLSPRAVREEITRRGWKTIVGFQTRNLGHRAHEHLQKIALEHVDGLLIHPLIGWKKPGDMLPEIILEGYEILIENYYVQANVMMSGLTTAMRYAGPKEAVFHSIIRKNFGCTHFIVGRDHAGVGGYYEKYAGHKIFDSFKDGELGIIPMRLHGPCYCRKCETCVTEHTCPHEDAWHDISGTEVRAMVAAGKRPPETFMRPEIGDFLVHKAKDGKVFF